MSSDENSFEPDCVICFDEENNSLEKIKCDRCNFFCCRKCYIQLQSLNCPKCNSNRFNVDLLLRIINSIMIEKNLLIHSTNVLTNDSINFRRHVMTQNHIRQFKLRIVCFIFSMIFTILLILTIFFGFRSNCENE